MEFDFPTETHTRRFGECLAQSHPPKAVVYLSGDLGAGKTTLSQAFITACGHTGRVKSPTYTLIESYPLPDQVIHHLDLYRLADPEELEYLGIDELEHANSLLLVEWPQRGEPVLPPADLTLTLYHTGNGRRLVAEPHTDTGRGWLAEAASHFT